MTAILTIVFQSAASSDIKTNEEGLEIIGNAEGCRRDAYICPAGRWTQGVGSTNNVDKNKLKTDKEIAKDFIFAIKEAEQCLNVYANGKELPINVFSAFTSFTFNNGCTRARNYTVYKLLHDGNIKEACELLPIYDKATVNGKKVALRGLTERRLKEKALCMKDIV